MTNNISTDETKVRHSEIRAALIADRGVTQRGLASFLGIDPGSLSLYLRGKPMSPFTVGGIESRILLRLGVCVVDSPYGGK